MHLRYCWTIMRAKVVYPFYRTGHGYIWVTITKIVSAIGGTTHSRTSTTWIDGQLLCRGGWTQNTTCSKCSGRPKDYRKRGTVPESRGCLSTKISKTHDLCTECGVKVLIQMGLQPLVSVATMFIHFHLVLKSCLSMSLLFSSHFIQLPNWI